MKYLYPYECEKKKLSTPAELQAAIDGNRREGRRTSYGQFESQMQQQLNMVRKSFKTNDPESEENSFRSLRCKDRRFPTVCSRCRRCHWSRTVIHRMHIDSWAHHPSDKCPALSHTTSNSGCSSTSSYSKHQKTWSVSWTLHNLKNI